MKMLSVIILVFILCAIYFNNKKESFENNYIYQDRSYFSYPNYNKLISDDLDHNPVNFSPTGYYWDPRWLGRRNEDCYKLTEKNCLNYSNCGLCDGNCIPGDENGPFFDSCNSNWKYKNYYDKNIFREAITKFYDPWNKTHINSPQSNPTPIARSSL
jgi:hypothetical protein